MHIPVDPNSRTAKVILVIGIPLYLALLYFQILDFKHAIDSRSWHAVDGIISTSEAEKTTTSYGEHDTPKIKYRYTVQGQPHENDKVAFGLFRGMLTWGHTEKLLTHYPSGKAVKVFYCPESPGLSCLQTGGLGWEDIFMLFVGGTGVVYGTRHLVHFIRWLSHRIVTPPERGGRLGGKIPRPAHRDLAGDRTARPR
jgi:hypothetical protein